MQLDDGFKTWMFTWIESIIKCELLGMISILHCIMGNKPSFTVGINPYLLDPPSVAEIIMNEEHAIFEHNFQAFVSDLAIMCN